MIDTIPKRLSVLRNYIYLHATTASTVAHERKVFILLDPSQPSIINALIMFYG